VIQVLAQREVFVGSSQGSLDLAAFDVFDFSAVGRGPATPAPRAAAVFADIAADAEHFVFADVIDAPASSAALLPELNLPDTLFVFAPLEPATDTALPSLLDRSAEIDLLAADAVFDWTPWTGGAHDPAMLADALGDDLTPGAFAAADEPAPLMSGLIAADDAAFAFAAVDTGAWAALAVDI
jgi:hypothetical protein